MIKSPDTWFETKRRLNPTFAETVMIRAQPINSLSSEEMAGFMIVSTSRAAISTHTSLKTSILRCSNFLKGCTLTK